MTLRASPRTALNTAGGATRAMLAFYVHVKHAGRAAASEQGRVAGGISDYTASAGVGHLLLPPPTRQHRSHIHCFFSVSSLGKKADSCRLLFSLRLRSQILEIVA